VYTKQPEQRPSFPLDNPQRIHFNPGSVIVYISIDVYIYTSRGIIIIVIIDIEYCYTLYTVHV
jgi:hypothetical protein